MTRRETVVAVLAALLGAFGVFMLGGLLIGALEQTSKFTPLTDAVMGVLFAGLPMGASGWMARGLWRASRQRKETAAEAAVLRVALAREAPVSALDVAAEAGVSVEEAEKCLARLHRRNFAEMDLTDQGVLVYRLSLSLSASETESSSPDAVPLTGQRPFAADAGAEASRPPRREPTRQA